MEKTENSKNGVSTKPVFFDPTSRRLVFFAVFSVVFLAFAAVWFFLFLAHLYASELPPFQTNEISEPDTGRGAFSQSYSGSPDIFSTTVEGDTGSSSLSDAARSNQWNATIPDRRNTEVHAFVPFWSQAGRIEAQANMAMIDVLLPEWFSIDAHDGGISNFQTRQRDKLLTVWKAHSDRVRLLPVVKTNVRHGGEPASWLSTVDQQNTLVDAAAKIVDEQEFDGLCLDFTGASANQVATIVSLTSSLSEKLALRGKESCIVAAMDDALLEHANIANLTDRLIVLAFQEPGPFSGPAPLADQRWFERRMRALTQSIPAEQLVIGLGSFGMDWVSGRPDPDYLSYFEVTEAVAQNKGVIKLDRESLNPVVSFSDAQGHRHQIWFLDAVNFHNQLARTPVNQVRGIALWPLSGGDPGVWELLSQSEFENPVAVSRLKTIRPASHVKYVGKGPLLSVQNSTVSGQREIVFDEASGLITDQVYRALPRAFTIALDGDLPEKSVILTFDDGPNRNYTPQILDILKDYDVPAVFFVVGSRVQRFPDIAKRIVEDGHELGVHTYYHPNIAEISELRLKFELHASQELIKSVTGLNTNLFRAPYGFDENPETPDEARILNLISDERYVVVGIEIDSSDWMRPGADRIVEIITTLVQENQGNVILLHDAGGDRHQTIEALPKIIETLQGLGVSILPLSTMSGPVDILHSVEAIESQNVVRDLSFWLVRWLKFAMTMAFFILIIIGITRSLGVLTLALIKERRPHRRGNAILPVSVLIPAYCEDTVITKAVNAALQSKYAVEEVIIIDDGSTDDTAKVVQENFGSNPRVRLIQQRNQGKAEALNNGISHIRTPVFVAIDADTIISPEAVGLLVRHFSDEKVGAVAGNVKVGNRRNLITRLQAIEYITAQNLDRRAFEVFNGIMVVPGAIGAWRTEAVIDSGGYTLETIVEDADLTVSIIRTDYSVVFEPDAHAFTEAPETIPQWMRQRLRWHFGMLQIAWKHKSAFLERRPVGMFSIPDLVVFGAIASVFAPIADFVMIINLIDLVGQAGNGNLASIETGSLVVGIAYIAYLLSDLVLATIAFSLEPKEDKRLLPWVLTQRFFYRQIYWMVALRSIARALTGQFTGWRKITRTSSISSRSALGLARAQGRYVSADKATR